MYLELFDKEILIVGCGNTLMGDDGFGPAVVESLAARYGESDRIGVFDAGTSVRELLFDLLLSGRPPRRLILVDAVHHAGVLPGEILCINVDQIPEKKVADYSLHQFPTTNMLKELQASSRVDIQIYVVQIDHIPETVAPGLSRPVRDAVPVLCHLIGQQMDAKDTRCCAGESFPC